MNCSFKDIQVNFLLRLWTVSRPGDFENESLFSMRDYSLQVTDEFQPLYMLQWEGVLHAFFTNRNHPAEEQQVVDQDDEPPASHEEPELGFDLWDSPERPGSSSASLLEIIRRDAPMRSLQIHPLSVEQSILLIISSLLNYLNYSYSTYIYS